MPVVKSSERTHQFVPEPFAFDVDPALALAVSIPAAMPTVAVVAVPNVAINFLTDLEFAILDLDALVALEILDLAALFEVGVLIGLLELRGFIDGLALLLRLRIRRRRDRDSEPKRGKDGKNEGKFLQHFSSSSRACLQLGGLCMRTDQNQTRNTVLLCGAAGMLGFPNQLSSD